MGSILDGTITRLMPFGVFVELSPGVEGMVHISELSWSKIKHPDQIVSTGDAVQAKVLGIEPMEKDPGRMKISLSVKQISEDPWSKAQERYIPGTVVRGKVVSLKDYGAFIELEEGIEGLVHISEMSWTRRVKHPSKVGAAGDVDAVGRGFSDHVVVDLAAVRVAEIDAGAADDSRDRVVRDQAVFGDVVDDAALCRRLGDDSDVEDPIVHDRDARAPANGDASAGPLDLVILDRSLDRHKRVGAYARVDHDAFLSLADREGVGDDDVVAAQREVGDAVEQDARYQDVHHLDVLDDDLPVSGQGVGWIGLDVDAVVSPH